MKFVDAELASERSRSAMVAFACLCLFSFTGLFASQTAETFPEVATIPVEEIHAGMRGYGLSVFKGTVPERFEVEVLGVLENQRPDGRYIVARLSGQNLEHTGVVAGMSGSPVYFEGRLAGAVAFAWAFATEPIAGITPIAAMRSIGVGGGPPALAGAAVPRGGAAELAEIASRRIPSGRLDEELGRFAHTVSNGGRSALLWGASGFGASSRALLTRLLPSSALSLAELGGGQRAEIDSDLGPGTSVAALFVDGDLRLAATGTVTDRIGEKLLAFGHSAIGVTEFSLPLATSEVITVMPSAMSSFKLSNSGQAVGSFERDHVYGSVGRIGVPAHTVPLRIHVRAPGERRFEMQLAELPAFLPALAAVGCLGAWDVAAGTAGVRSVDLQLRVELGGIPERPPLVLDQSFDGEGAATDSIGYLMSVLTYLSRNDLAPLDVRAISVDVGLFAEPRAATLTIVRAEPHPSRPGRGARPAGGRPRMARREPALERAPRGAVGPPGRQVLAADRRRCERGLGAARARSGATDPHRTGDRLSPFAAFDERPGHPRTPSGQRPFDRRRAAATTPGLDASDLGGDGSEERHRGAECDRAE